MAQLCRRSSNTSPKTKQCDLMFDLSHHLPILLLIRPPPRIAPPRSPADINAP